MKVLVTGGAGFIGSNLVHRLTQQGISVRVMDILSRQVHGEVPTNLGWIQDLNIEFMRASVTDRPKFAQALQGVDAVVHLAAETGTGQSMYEIARYNEVNVMGTANLFDLLANDPSHTVRRVVLASSRSVYGEGAFQCCSITCQEKHPARQFPPARSSRQLKEGRWEHPCRHCGEALFPIPTHEDDPARPASIYAATKYSQEDIVRIGCESLNIGYASLRLQNVYGAGQSLRNPYTGILSIFATRIRQGRGLGVFEDGKESRDFVNIDDVVAAFERVLTREQDVNCVINVGSGQNTSILEVAHQLCRHMNSKVPVAITGEYRLGDIRHNFADIGKLDSILGLRPEVPIEMGLKRFCEWVDLLSGANEELRSRKLMG